jgi:toxin CptA
MAQTLWLLLLWLLLREARAPSRAGPALVALAAALCATTHVGALVLVAAMLALLAAAAVVRLRAAVWRPLAVTLGAVGLVLIAIYFSAAAAPVLAQPPDPRARTLAQTLARGVEMRDVRLALVGSAWSLGFTAPLLAAVPAGLLLLWGARARHALQRALLGGWVGVSALFFAVYMALGLLTRYIYFDVPLVCLAGGAVLAGLGRSRAGRVAAVALALFVLATGVALWFGGVLLRDKPSLVPLTH